MREVSGKLTRHLATNDEATADCRHDLSELLAREEALARELDYFHLRTPAGRS